MSVNRWLDTQTVVYWYTGILLSDEKEWTIDTHNNMSEFQNDYAEWKPDAPPKKEYVLYDSIYVKI